VATLYNVRKVRKTKKMTKVGKIEVFEKKSGKLTKLKENVRFVCLNLQNSLFSKAFKW